MGQGCATLVETRMYKPTPYDCAPLHTACDCEHTHTHTRTKQLYRECLTCPGGRKRRYGCSSRLCVAEFTVCSDVRVVTKSAEPTPLLSRPGKLKNPPFTLNLLYVCCARCRCCVTGRLTLAHNTHTHTHAHTGIDTHSTAQYSCMEQHTVVAHLTAAACSCGLVSLRLLCEVGTHVALAHATDMQHQHTHTLSLTLSPTQLPNSRPSESHSGTVSMCLFPSVSECVCVCE